MQLSTVPVSAQYSALLGNYLGISFTLVHTELERKGNTFNMTALPLAFLSWSVGHVIHLYSLYFGISYFTTISIVIQFVAYATAIAVTINMALIMRMDSHRVDTSSSVMEEFAFFSYMIPTLIYAPLGAIWNYSTNNTNSATYSELSFMVTLVLHYVYGVSIIGASKNHSHVLYCNIFGK